jgi:hypothetical protein
MASNSFTTLGYSIFPEQSALLASARGDFDAWEINLFCSGTATVLPKSIEKNGSP